VLTTWLEREIYQLQTTELSLSKSYVHVMLVATPNVISIKTANIWHLVKHVYNTYACYLHTSYKLQYIFFCRIHPTVLCHIKN
jgi:hypothetical protein